MKRIGVTGLILVALLASNCTTTPPQTAPKPVASPVEKTKPLLWEVRKPNYPKSYLFGTIHLGVHPKELHPIVWTYLKESEQVVLEADVMNADREAIQKSIFLPKGKSMKKMLGNEYWSLLLKKAPQISPSTLERMSPHGLINILQSKAFQGQTSMDLEIHKRAKSSKKSMVFLETVKFQTGLLSKLFTLDTVKDFLKQDDQAPFKSLMEFSEVYRSGNEDRIYTMMINPPENHLKMSPEHLKMLIDDRNQNWATLLDTIFRRGKSFVAVGAGHMAGPQGLLELLKKRGFAITRYEVEPGNM